jgi:hypothetical protein
LPATAANIQRVHTAAIGGTGAGMAKEENSFTKKLKDNREAYRM